MSAIRVRDLSFRYPGTKGNTVEGLNFTVDKGEIFGFLGPSGAGKTTTQKILIGILKGYEGTVEVMGQDLQTVHGDFYENIGVAFETPNLYERFTALENLNFFASLYAGTTLQPEDLLEAVDLTSHAFTRVSAFSKGMKVRLNYCRALLCDPEVLFLDEPTAGLDPVNARRIKDSILDLQQDGTTVFLTTHDLSVVEEVCNRVAFMVGGRICLMDTPRALKLQGGAKTVRVEYRQGDGIQVEEFPLPGLGTNASFLRILQEEEVETLHTLEASLAHVFIEVTGRSLL